MNVSSLSALRMTIITLLLTTALRRVLGERRFIFMCAFAILIITVLISKNTPSETKPNAEEDEEVKSGA